MGTQRKSISMINLITWCDHMISYLKKAGIEFIDDYPVLPKESYYKDIPLTIESFQFRNMIPEDIRHRSLVCNFSKDDRLINRLYKIDEEIRILQQYGGICGFDLSASVTMLRPRQRLSLLVSALFNCYVALHGIKVLPNCRVGDLANMSVLRSIPPYSNIISGELGCKKNGFKGYGLYQLRIITKKIVPEIMFIYGNISKKDILCICSQTPQNFLVYPSARSKYRNGKTPQAIIWNGSSACTMSLINFINNGGVQYGS